jgi:hypothetical protein
VPVNFPRKLTKDKVVKFQSLELAGWYQTGPFYGYSKLDPIRELQSIKQNIAERMMQA